MCVLYVFGFQYAAFLIDFLYARLYSLKLEESKVKWNFKLYVCFLRWSSLWLLNPTGSYLHKALLTGLILAYKNSYIVYGFFFLFVLMQLVFSCLMNWISHVQDSCEPYYFICTEFIRMPLLKRKPFPLAKLPNDLDPNELVYQVRFTEEIFRDYEYPFFRP